MGQLGLSHDYPASKEPPAGFSSTRPQTTLAHSVASLRLRAPDPLPLPRSTRDTRGHLALDGVPSADGLPSGSRSPGSRYARIRELGADGTPPRLAPDAYRHAASTRRSQRPLAAFYRQHRRRRAERLRHVPNRHPARLGRNSGKLRTTRPPCADHCPRASAPPSHDISTPVTADVLPGQRRARPAPPTIDTPTTGALDVDATTAHTAPHLPDRTSLVLATPRRRAASAPHPYAQCSAPVTRRGHAVPHRRSHHSGRPDASADCCPAPGTRPGRASAGRASGLSAYVLSTAPRPTAGNRPPPDRRVRRALLERPDDAPHAGRTGGRLDAGAGIPSGSGAGMTTPAGRQPRRNAAPFVFAQKRGKSAVSALRNATRRIEVPCSVLGFAPATWNGGRFSSRTQSVTCPTERSCYATFATWSSTEPATRRSSTAPSGPRNSAALSSRPSQRSTTAAPTAAWNNTAAREGGGPRRGRARKGIAVRNSTAASAAARNNTRALAARDSTALITAPSSGVGMAAARRRTDSHGHHHTGHSEDHRQATPAIPAGRWREPLPHATAGEGTRPAFVARSELDTRWGRPW